MMNQQALFAFVTSARKSWGGHFIARSVVLVLTVLGALDSFAQSQDVPVSFTLGAPLSTCEVAKLEDVDFGILGRPAPEIEHEYGFALLDSRRPEDPLRVYAGVTKNGGNPSLGKLRIRAGNAATLTLTWGFPSHLIMEENKIRYSHGHYSHSRSENGPWVPLDHKHVYTLPNDKVEEATGTHYLQIGGTIYIYPDTPPGHYISRTTVSVACPE